ncbi:TrbI/VirB10 family protein [Pararhizobium mangrovi]|uniref:TrbI/VirB10 family protein n=1 Tax=Pararhizobium mangrovi TaxID=2590452 RepID=A0A506U2K1_9HYPH|nr:TrbI/VirB10 family protein [Pararhizobium mangrovi]TPW27688.1 TrbI/VirB10 family protein [Pararhizobium mangrovi]
MTDQPESRDDEAAPASKVDSEASAAAFRLRPSPPRVTRLSRKVLAGLGLTGGLLLGGAAIYALQGPSDRATSPELVTTEARPTPDGLRSLPKDYSQVPKLGPPLPGDLGRPIVKAREAGQPVPAQTVPGPDPAEQRRLQEVEAARTSQLFASQQGSGKATPLAASGASVPAIAGASGSASSARTTATDRQRAFVDAPVDRRTVSVDRLAAPISPYVLQAGSVIPAALVTGIRSDLPGQITAQVTENVYDSPTGRFLLLPQGTRLIGEYDSGVGFGQARVLLVWTRAILPNGRSLVLERQPGADTNGFAGLEDGVDYHWWDLAKAAGLSTLLGVGADLAIDDDQRLLRAIRDGAQDSVNDAGQKIVQRQLGVKPTLTIRPGLPVRVIVTRDLVLEPYGETR